MSSGAPARAARGGIPIWWADAPGPFDAALHFRVGYADEPLPMAGITHLVEHLVMRAVGRREHPCNAMVDATECLFYADGEPEELFEFFALVAAAVRDVPLADLERECRILAVEAGSRGSPVIDRLLELRYGNAGYGIGGQEEFGLRWVGEEQVRGWCATHFTRGNAGMWMTAEPPEDFVLELPDGPSRPAPVPVTRLAGLPGFVADRWARAALSGVAPRSSALTLVTAVAEERLYARLREEHGLAYAPFSHYQTVGAADAHVVLGTDGRDDDTALALEELWRCVNELAEHGAREDELDRQRRATARDRRAPDTLASDLSYAVTSELEGRARVSADERDARFDAVDGAATAAAMQALLERALLLGPVNSRPPAGSLAPLAPPAGEPIDGELFVLPRAGVRRRRGAARLWVGERGVRLDDADAPVTLAWDEVALAERRPAGELRLVSLDDRAFVVAPHRWEDGERALALIRARLPAGVLVPDGERGVGEAIDRAVARRLGDAADVAVPLGELAGDLSAAEGLVDVVVGTRTKGREVGLLVLTERRLYWSASRTRQAQSIDFHLISRASARNGELVVEAESGKFGFVITPRSAAEELASAIGQRIAA